MELRHLRSFVAVARELHFTRAAARLRLAQPALSRQIRQLEDEVGTRLLERDRHGVRLTPAGAALLEEAEVWLEQSVRVLAAARRPALEKQALTIGYVWGLFHSTAPEALQRFRVSHPDVAVNLLDLTATQQVAALRAGTIDLGLIGLVDETVAAGLAHRRIGECGWVVALPAQHPAARQRRVALPSLAGNFFLTIAEENYPGASRQMRIACERAGIRPRFLRTAERGHTMLGLVAGGCGVALVPEPLQALPHPGVIFRPLTPALRTGLCAAWMAREARPLVKDFLRCLKRDDDAVNRRSARNSPKPTRSRNLAK